MPAKHRSEEPFISPWVIVAAVIIVAGFVAAGILLAREYRGQDGEPASTPEPVSVTSVDPLILTVTPEPTPSPTPEPTPSPTPAPIPDNGQDGYLSGGIYVWNNMGFELFYGNNEAAEPYAQAIEGFAAQLPGVNVYSMVVPNHSEFGLPERLRNSLNCGSQRENTAHIYSLYSNAIPVDIYDTLNQHKEEYIYYNTDTHWTSLGAYYAYEAFCQTAGLQPAALDSFALESHPDFHGYLYQVTGEDCLWENADHIDLYEPGYPYAASLSSDGWSFSELPGVNGSDASAGYSMYLWGDQPCFRIVNEFSFTRRKLALVKESYGNPIGPFLAASFDEVYAIDFRTFPGSLPDFIAQNEITDVLFLNSAMAANTYDRVQDLSNLFP